MNIVKFKEISSFSKEILKILQSLEGQIVIGLSGGSTIPPILKELMPFIHKNTLQERITWTWIDERLVPYEVEGSNYGSVKPFFNTRDKCIPLPNIDSLKNAQDYQKNLYLNKLPELDFLILGYGEDGHIASLFPEEKERTYTCSEKEWIFRSVASYSPKERWTWGMNALSKSKNTFILFKGLDNSKKKQRLEEAISNTHNTPLAEFIRKTQGNIKLYQIDQ